MKRVKIKPKANSKEKQITKKASYEAVEFLTTMVEIVLRDKFKFNNNQIEKFKKDLNKYCEYIADGTVSISEVKQLIERKKNEDKIQ